MAIDEEKELRALEEAFPDSADRVFQAARQKALESGSAVMETSGDAVFRVYPDGQREFVAHIPAPQVHKIGSRFRLR